MSSMSESEAQDYLFQMQKKAVIGSWTGMLEGCRQQGYDHIPFALVEQMLLGLKTTSREGFDHTLGEANDDST